MSTVPSVFALYRWIITRPHVAALFGYAALTLLVFGDVLIRRDGTVVSHQLGDGSFYFSRMRPFAMREMMEGNLPLWNPHIYSGTPFIGAFQSAMFYPAICIYALFSVSTAMNLDFTIHVVLASYFVFLWTGNRGLSPLAAFFSGAIFAFGGAFFVRVMAGHLTMVQAMAWAPLICLSVEQIFERPRPGPVFLGIFATTMQLLAGHPQTTYLTAFSIGLYCALRLIRCQNRTQIALALIPVAVGPLFIAAIQLLPGIDVAGESIRAGGVDYEFASTFSFHPESMVTLLVPTFFGNATDILYWGRWAYWDATVFMGLTGLTFAVLGTLIGKREHRQFAVTMCIVFVVLAFGQYAPIYRFVYDYVPGIASFRAPSKFMFPASLYGAVLAGAGLDATLRGVQIPGFVPKSLRVLAVIALVGSVAAWFSWSPRTFDSPIRDLIEFRRLLEHTYFILIEGISLPDAYYRDIARFLALSLFLAGLSALALAILIVLSKRSRYALYLAVFLGIAEVLVFARTQRTTFDISSHDRPGIDELYRSATNDFRVLDVGGIDNSTRNRAIDLGKYTIWGYEPVILDRYGIYIALAMGGRRLESKFLKEIRWGNDPATLAVHGTIEDGERHFHFSRKAVHGDLTLLRGLRCRYIVVNPGTWDGSPGFWGIDKALPRFLLVEEYEVCDDRAEVIAELANRRFDPAEKVILESSPNPVPALIDQSSQNLATMRILYEDTDTVEFIADLPMNSILLITDSYSKGWRARAMEGSAQDTYEILPANLAVRAIPLKAGRHHMRMEYLPRSFIIGRAVTLVSLGIYTLFLTIWIGHWYRRRRNSVRNSITVGFSPDSDFASN